MHNTTVGFLKQAFQLVQNVLFDGLEKFASSAFCMPLMSIVE
jgi:hypothetical protein